MRKMLIPSAVIAALALAISRGHRVARARPRHLELRCRWSIAAVRPHWAVIARTAPRGPLLQVAQLDSTMPSRPHAELDNASLTPRRLTAPSCTHAA